MNRRLALVSLILSVALGACMPGLAPVSGGDSQATALAEAGTLAAQTLAALPSPTLAPTDTPLPTLPPTIAPSATLPPTETFSPTPEATSTAAGSTATATLLPASATATIGTLTATLSPTPGILLWGTVPPDIPFGRVHFVNLSNRMVYISFHCVLPNGLTSYLEYPVYSKLAATIPAGRCYYVAFVKYKEFTGDIRIGKGMEYTFIFRPKGIQITQP